MKTDRLNYSQPISTNDLYDKYFVEHIANTFFQSVSGYILYKSFVKDLYIYFIFNLGLLVGWLLWFKIQYLTNCNGSPWNLMYSVFTYATDSRGPNVTFSIKLCDFEIKHKD